MKSSAKDNAEGKMHQVKGNAKQVAGIIAGNEVLEVDGKEEHSKGKIQEKVSQIKKVMDQ